MIRWGLLFLCACVTRTELELALDRDGDGYQPIVAGGPDCDETRGDVNPGAVEVCGDGIDNDCDGFIDDSGTGDRTWYRDVDGDGFGIDETVSACTEPQGFAPVPNDCDDNDASISPAAEDLCDGIDQDCDGFIDDDADALIQFRDDDGDGFGRDDDTVTGCGLTPGYVLASGDCDDTVASISPSAEDVCDGLDQNCNGVIDEDVVFTVQYEDADGDGDGNPLVSVEACENLSGYVAVAADCNDADPTYHSNAVDFCDGQDQDCDGIPDSDVTFETWYADNDQDGVGAVDFGVFESCEPLEGFSLLDGDCNDDDDSISPLVNDGCDGIDSDCDGNIDDDALLTLYFPDHDGDGIGTVAGAVEACIPPDGFVQLGGDCDDEDPAVRPDQTDACDGADQDCDGAIDEDAEFRLWWTDADGDGVGTGDPVFVCETPAHAAQIDGDCNDHDPNVRPGVDDTCDGVDSDCDGVTDQLGTFAFWFADHDEDGLGHTSESVSTCDGAPAGFVSTPGDCDDGDASVQIPIWYLDEDADGWGVEEFVVQCEQPVGYADRSGDCDDTTPAVTPANVEICKTGLDEDCEPATDCLLRGLHAVSTGLGPSSSWTAMTEVGQVTLVGNVVGGPMADFILRSEFPSAARMRVVDGDTLDFENPVEDTGQTCVGPESAFISGGPYEDILCHWDGDILVFQGSIHDPPITTFSNVPSTSFLPVESGPFGPGIWTRNSNSIFFVPFGTGIVDMSAAVVQIDVNPTGQLRLGGLVPCHGSSGNCVYVSDSEGTLLFDPVVGGVWDVDSAVATVPNLFAGNAAEDVNGDGIKDLVFFTSQYLAGPISHGQALDPLMHPTLGYLMPPNVVPDLDGDSRADSMYITGSVLTIHHTTSRVEPTPVSWISDSTSISDVKFSDFDSDGYGDVLFLERRSGETEFTIRYGNGL